MTTPTITRADGSTVEPQILQFGSRTRKRERKRIIEPVVDLDGNVIPAEVNTDLDKAGIRLVVLSQGQLQLTLHAKRHGMVFYRDMCMGKVDGVDASPIHWTIYEKVSAMRAEGRVPKGGYPNEKLYHPEIMRRRALGRGVARIDHAEMDKILDSLRAQDTAEDITAAKKRGMKVPTNSGKQSVEQLMAEANSK